MLLALLVACAPSWEGFIEQKPEAICVQQMACAAGAYDSEDECVDEMADALADEEEPENYDAQAAADCLELSRHPDCSDEGVQAWSDACHEAEGA